MKLVIPSVGVAIIAAMASVAVAQIPPPPPRVSDVMPGTSGLDGVEREAFRKGLVTPGGEPVDREALANRVGALVDQGKCEEARALARSEGDRAMARRVGRICREGQPAAQQ